MKHFEKVLSNRYARAYMMLDKVLPIKDAQEMAKAKLDAIYKLRECTGSLKNILLHPLIPFPEKLEFLKKTTEKILAKEVLNFAELLIRENRYYLLDSIIEESEKVLENYLGQVRVDVVSRNLLTDAEISRLKKILGSLTKKEVLISQTSSEDIIGGIEIKIGDLIIDATVRSKLLALKKKVISS